MKVVIAKQLSAITKSVTDSILVSFKTSELMRNVANI